jgi:hypothetical protein
METPAPPTGLKLVFPRHCMFGDFDLMLHDSLYKESLTFYLSVEDLSSGAEVVTEILGGFFGPGSSARPFNGKTAPAEKVKDLYEHGYAVSEGLETLARSGKYLVSVCSDSTEKPSCVTNKTVVDIGKLLVEYQPPKPDFVPADHVYFSQGITKHSDRVGVFSDVAHEGNEAQIQDEYGKEAASRIQLLASLPLAFHDNALVIGLPVFSPKKCGKVS